MFVSSFFFQRLCCRCRFVSAECAPSPFVFQLSHFELKAWLNFCINFLCFLNVSVDLKRIDGVTGSFRREIRCSATIWWNQFWENFHEQWKNSWFYRFHFGRSISFFDISINSVSKIHRSSRFSANQAACPPPFVFFLLQSFRHAWVNWPGRRWVLKRRSVSA